MKLPIFLIIIFSFFVNHSVFSQKDTIPKIDIGEVVIHAVRLPAKNLNLPNSITSVSYKNDQNNKQQLTLNEYLSNIPGLFSLNANNFAQDLRISIRGFGARSSFGIRGVKIIVDGNILMNNPALGYQIAQKDEKILIFPPIGGG